MPTILRATIALGLIALAFPARAAAPPDAESAEIAALDPAALPLIAVPLSEAPGATTVITAEEIARSGAANIFELLRRVPGVGIRYTPMGGHISIRSSGTSPFTEQVLLLIDGSPYNSPDKGGFPGHPNYTGFFPLDRIARIEVIKGPISVLYGANAFSGVINIVTKKAGETVTAPEGQAYAADLTAGEENVGEARLGMALVRGDWRATLFAGLEGGNTPIRLNREADHDRSNVYAAVERGNFRASMLHTRNRYGAFPFIDTVTREPEHSVDVVDAHYRRRVGATVLRIAGAVNRYRGTTCGVCHNNQTGAPDDAVTGDIGAERETDTRFWGSVRADRTLGRRHDVTFGVEVHHDRIERRVVVQPGAQRTGGGGGTYLQHEWRPLSRLHLISGVRLDWAEDLGRAASPRVAVVGEPRSDLLLRASWSRAYRSPTWNERFIRQRVLPEEISPGTILLFQGHPDLERERNDSLEIGASWRASDAAVLKLDLYRNEVHDSIERGPSVFVPGSPSEIRQTYRNRRDPFTIRGGELTLEMRPHATLSFNAAWARSEVGVAREDPAAAYAPRDRAMLTLAWIPRPDWTVDLAGSWAAGYTVSLPQVFGLRPQPSYEIVDVALRRTLRLDGDWSIELGVLGRNVTDSRPAETLVNEEVDTHLRGRSLAFELRARF